MGSHPALPTYCQLNVENDCPSESQSAYAPRFQKIRCFFRYPSHLTPSARIGITSRAICLSMVHPAYPFMTLFMENPSLVLPLKKLSHNSGTPTMIPVSRTNQELLTPSYISPNFQMIVLFVFSFPLPTIRKSRTANFDCNDTPNWSICILAAASC